MFEDVVIDDEDLLRQQQSRLLSLTEECQSLVEREKKKEDSVRDFMMGDSLTGALMAGRA